MSIFHDEVEIEDFEWDEEAGEYRYPCPCGDVFFITKEELADGEDIARCSSCSLIVRVIYDEADFEYLDDAETETAVEPALAEPRDEVEPNPSTDPAPSQPEATSSAPASMTAR